MFYVCSHGRRAPAPPLRSAPGSPPKGGARRPLSLFRGFSGRRYLFSTVDRTDLGDFRAAVVMVARRAPNGRLAAHWITVLDIFGRPTSADRRWPPIIAVGDVVLVHLLSADDLARRDLVADLTPPPAFALAA